MPDEECYDKRKAAHGKKLLEDPAAKAQAQKSMNHALLAGWAKLPDPKAQGPGRIDGKRRRFGY